MTSVVPRFTEHMRGCGLGSNATVFAVNIHDWLMGSCCVSHERALRVSKPPARPWTVYM